MEVTSMFHICRYCVFTWDGRYRPNDDTYFGLGAFFLIHSHYFVYIYFFFFFFFKLKYNEMKMNEHDVRKKTRN